MIIQHIAKNAALYGIGLMVASSIAIAALMNQVETIQPPREEAKIENFENYEAARDKAVKEYHLKHYEEDKEKNIERLMEAGAHRSQMGISTPLFTRTDKTAAETGNLEIVVYNIIVEGHPSVTFDLGTSERLEEFTNKAAKSLDIHTNITYREVEVSEDSDLGQLIINNPIVDSYSRFDLLNSDGKTNDLETALRDRLEVLLGDELAVLRNANLDPNGNNGRLIVDAIAILSNFKDSRAAGVEISFSSKGDDGFTLQDIAQDIAHNGYSPYSFLDIWSTFVHETIGHKIGLPHTDEPLDIMSYSIKGKKLVERFPELAFSEESQNTWNQIKTQYEPGFIPSATIVFSPEVCAGSLAFAYATLPGENYKVVAALTNLQTGDKTFQAEFVNWVERDNVRTYLNRGDYGTIVITDMGIGDNNAAVAIYRMDIENAIPEVQDIKIKGIDCTNKLEELASENVTSGQIAEIILPDKIPLGAEDIDLLSAPQDYYGELVVLDNNGESLTYNSFFRGGPFRSGTGIVEYVNFRFDIKEPGIYRAFVVAYNPDMGAELLTKTFEVVAPIK